MSRTDNTNDPTLSFGKMALTEKTIDAMISLDSFWCQLTKKVMPPLCVQSDEGMRQLFDIFDLPSTQRKDD